jgi:hypothetical protein
VAEVWAIVIVGAVLALVTAAILTWRHGRARHGVIGASIGAIGGMLGAFLILTSRLDVVPDALEGWAVATLIVTGSLGLIVVTWLRWARR